LSKNPYDVGSVTFCLIVALSEFGDEIRRIYETHMRLDMGCNHAGKLSDYAHRKSPRKQQVPMERIPPNSLTLPLERRCCKRVLSSGRCKVHQTNTHNSIASVLIILTEYFKRSGRIILPVDGCLIMIRSAPLGETIIPTPYARLESLAQNPDLPIIISLHLLFFSQSTEARFGKGLVHSFFARCKTGYTNGYSAVLTNSSMRARRDAG
jgi:hypothetical protein